LLFFKKKRWLTLFFFEKRKNFCEVGIRQVAAGIGQWVSSRAGWYKTITR
jgi:hypothetical protein